MTTEVIDEMKQFQLFVPFTNKSQENTKYSENGDGTITIEGIASTTNKDLQGDIILPSAIQSMKQQLLTTTKNLHGDHNYGLDGIYGAITEVLDSDDSSLKVRSILRKSKSPEIKEMLDIGVNLGLSIGGKITEYTILEDHGWEIKDLRLMEISLTGMPANWDTYGTIQESADKSIVKAKCLAGACHVIRKNIGDIMADVKKEETEVFTKEDAVDLFNELMATKQEEIARETVDQVRKELENIVQEKLDELNETPSTEEEGEETEKEIPEEENDEEKEKALLDLINKSVGSAMENSLGKLFKNLEENRDPQFKVDAVKEQEVTDDDEKDDDQEKGLTSRELAEKMFDNQSQDSFIRSLLG